MPKVTAKRMSFSRTVLAGGLGLVTALALGAWRAEAGDLVVRYDQSQILRLPRNPTEVIIGNPTIAEVTIQGGNLLVVTGKSFGITNIIALDAERNVIQDQRILVERDERRIVNLHKGGARQSYACTPSCNPTITIGDDNTFFDTATKHAQQKMKFSEGSGDTGNQGGQ